jgi:hypothetical protein
MIDAAPIPAVLADSLSGPGAVNPEPSIQIGQPPRQSDWSVSELQALGDPLRCRDTAGRLARSLFGVGADRGVVLGAQVLDALGVRGGPGGRSAVVVAEPAPPDHGVHRRHRVNADHLSGGQADGDGHGVSLP